MINDILIIYKVYSGRGQYACLSEKTGSRKQILQPHGVTIPLILMENFSFYSIKRLSKDW